MANKGGLLRGQQRWPTGWPVKVAYKVANKDSLLRGQQRWPTGWPVKVAFMLPTKIATWPTEIAY